MKQTIWNKIFRNILSNLAGTVVGLIVGFFLMPFVIHRIGLTEFGIWMLVNSLVGYMGILDVGLYPTLIKKSAELLAKEDKVELSRTVSTIFTLYFLIGILIGFAIFGLSFLFPHVFNVSSENINTFKLVLWIIGLQTAISFPMSIWQGLLGGLQDFHVINGITIVTNIIRAIATVILLTSGFGLISLIWLGFGLAFIGWVTSIFWIKRRIPFLKINISKFEWTKVRDLSKFSGVMFIWRIAGTILHHSDRIIIGLFLPIATITIYEVGLRITNYSRTLLDSFTNVFIPASSELNSKNDKYNLQKLYLIGTRYLFIAYSAITVMLLMFGREFILLWMGKGFEKSVWIMYALLIGSLYQSQNVIGYNIMVGRGKLRAFTWAMVGYPIINIVLSIIFVIKWGLIGVALAKTLTFILVDTFFIFYLIRVFEIRLLTLLRVCNLPAIISVTPALAVSYYLQKILNIYSWPGLFLEVSSFFLTYVLSCLFFGISRDERNTLKEKILIASGKIIKYHESK
jgi:O-antigen/teichoic acid export membrane protein